MSLREIRPQEIQDNPFSLIGDDWMLVSAGKPDACNTMTASWGGIGILWGKPVAFSFVRPSRYTFGLIEQEKTYSLCFFNESYRDVLRLCGRVSGRDTDKIAKTGLTVASVDGVPYFEEARLVLVCKVLYQDDIRPSCFVEPSLSSNYQQQDYHRSYVGEIVHAFVKD